MKKIYTLLAVSAVAFSAAAQTAEGPQPFAPKTTPYVFGANHDRMLNPDTTGIVNVTDFMPAFDGTSPTFYSYTGGGYLYGNNASANSFKEVAQGYQNVNGIPVKIIGALMWFGAKESDMGSSGTSKVVIKAYNMVPNGSYNQNGGALNITTLNWPGPSTAIASADLLFSNIDTVNFNYVAFSPAPTTGTAIEGFAIGCDVSTLAAGDTTGLVSDAQNDAMEADYAFHKIVSGSTNKWFVSDQIFSPSSSGYTGGLDNDIALWAVVSDATGIDEFFNGIKMTTYPNPAVDNVTIEYTLQKDAKNVTMFIMDPNGRKIMNNAYIGQSAGTYKVNFDASKLAAGTYFYQVNADGHDFTKQLVITK
ncbi:MAG: T9SS type A sorting domain-containing protein [Bacteroidia bacterium]